MVRVPARVGSFVAVLVCAYVFFHASTTHAALLYLDPGQVSVYRGDSVTLGLRIDTDEGECINTVDATIKYDPSIRAVDVSRGNSILNIWLENPVIDEEAHTIHFVAGIPGGYCGRIPGDPSLTNVLLELVFRSPGFSISTTENQNARIWVDESSQVLLHDGYGSPAQVRYADAQIALLETGAGTPTDAWKEKTNSDIEPPSDFSIILTRDDVAFNNEYFVVFNSVDKQSGIDHYEIMEEPFREFYAFKWGRADAPWMEVESPYVLRDQTLNSTIRVKAIDKAGNERIAVLVPDIALRSISTDLLITILVIGGVVVLISVLVFFALWKRKQRILVEADSTES